MARYGTQAVQIALGLAFVGARVMKTTKPREELIENGMAYMEDLSPNAVKAIGALELLAGIGLVLPPAVDVLPVLSAFAAAGLVLIMIGAAVFHIRRAEFMPSLLVNAVLGGLALFVAIGRFGTYSF